MWASASSDMFSINITKTKQQLKAEQNKMRGGQSEKKIAKEGAELREWFGEKKRAYGE